VAVLPFVDASGSDLSGECAQFITDEVHRRGRRELARMVCRLHGLGAERRRASAMNSEQHFDRCDSATQLGCGRGLQSVCRRKLLRPRKTMALSLSCATQLTDRGRSVVIRIGGRRFVFDEMLGVQGCCYPLKSQWRLVVVKTI
jgi:hypothetical protein